MMKKITLLMLTLVSLSLNAQVYFTEDFEGQTVDTEPTGFTVINNDACNVNTPASFPNEAWMVDDLGDAQGQMAAAMSWTVPSCTVSDWLITSAIDLTSATALTTLKWKGISQNASFLETYEVRLSTTGTAVADFTTLLATVTDEAALWTGHEVSMATYVGGPVYIAFVLISTDEDRAGIDDIFVSEPAAFDMEITALNSVGIKQKSAFSSGNFLVVDYSKRTNFTSEAVLTNIGVNAVNEAYVTFSLTDDIQAPTFGAEFTDTIIFAPALAPGASYTHTFEAFGLDTLFPTLGADQVLDFYAQVDSSAFNLVSDVLDFKYQIMIAPAVSYAAPYTTSFEVADLAAGQFLFDHTTWGWKYFDNDQDGVTLAVNQDFSNLPAQDGGMQVYGSLSGSTIGIGADDDRMESPELSLTGGTAYAFSIWARTAFNQTASLQCQLTSAAGAYTNTLGTITMTGADSTYKKYTFSIVAPSTQTDFKVRYNKLATGFLVADLFDLAELQQPTANISLNASSTDETGIEYCDSIVTVNFSAQGNPSSLSLNWGDGTVVNVTGLSTASHTYTTFGSYTIEITATNIVGSGTANTALSFTALPAPTVTFGPPVVSGLNVNVSVGSAIGTNVVYTPRCSRVIIDWGDGIIDEVTGSSSGSHSYAAPGTYTIEVTIIGSGSASATQTITVVDPNGIADLNFANALNIFPNPANDIVNVSFALVNSANIDMSVYSVDGKMIDVRSFENTKEVNTSFNTTSLNNGVYIMKIRTEEGTSTQKFVVNHN